MPKTAKSSKQEESLSPYQTKHQDSANKQKKSILSKFFDKLHSVIKKPKKHDDAFLHIIKQLRANVKIMSLEEKEILVNFLKFGSKTVEDAMLPRSDIAAVPSNISLEDLNKSIIKLAHTRTLVYEDTLDNIVGFIHIKDLFKVLAKKQDFHLKKIMRKPIIAAPSMKLIDLLAEMQGKRTHIAIVVDEYGGTDGIVTIEDIMEEIVGRIEDEHDRHFTNDSYKIINATTIISSSRIEVEELEKIMGLKLGNEDDEFDTIGGLVMAKTNNVPLPGCVIEISNDVEIEVIDASPRALKQVKIKLKNGHIPLDTTQI